MLWGDWNVCVIESPRSSLDKRRIFRKPTRPSLPLRKAPPLSPSLSSIVFATPSVPLLGDRNPQGRENVTALQCYICPTYPSPAGGSLIHSQALALSKRARNVTAPSRCSEPLRSMDGGASKPSPDCAGWDRLGKLYFFTLIIIDFLKLWN